MNHTAFARTITELDYVRIYKLLERQGTGTEAAARLSELIDAAEQVRPQDVAPDVVTMLTRVRVADPDGGGERTLTLVYPPEADASRGLISVLSPLGASLLGLRAGETAEWRGQGGKAGTLLVRAIEFQPEAHGDYTD